MARTINLFISHSWNYGYAYDNLLRLLQTRPYFNFCNYSIPSYNPVHVNSDRALKQAIYNRMRLCHVLLVFAGVYATYSKWINAEITVAQNGFSYPKPIVAVVPRGQMNISRVVGAAADEIVGWNTESIVRAIRRVC